MKMNPVIWLAFQEVDMILHIFSEIREGFFKDFSHEEKAWSL
jgi:hypothetical protein